MKEQYTYMCNRSILSNFAHTNSYTRWWRRHKHIHRISIWDTCPFCASKSWRIFVSDNEERQLLSQPFYVYCGANVCVCILSIEEKHEWQECRFWSIFKCCIFFVFAKWKTEQRNNTRTQTFFCVLEFPKEEEKSGCKQTKKKDRIFFVKNPYSNQ